MLEAIFGLIGVVVGAVIAGMQSWLDARKTRLESARYLAIRVVCALDTYVDNCTSAVCDDGLSFGQRNKDGYLEPQVPTPAPIAYAADVDWRSIEHALMYELLSLPNRAEAANAAIDFSWEIASPPDFDEFFEERQRRYTELGLKAAALAAALRAQYEIPSLMFGEWNPVERLEREKRSLEALDRERASRSRSDFLADNN